MIAFSSILYWELLIEVFSIEVFGLNRRKAELTIPNCFGKMHFNQGERFSAIQNLTGFEIASLSPVQSLCEQKQTSSYNLIPKHIHMLFGFLMGLSSCDHHWLKCIPNIEKVTSPIYRI